MDGAIPSLSADSTSRFTSRFQLSSSAGSARSLQSGLFEQLLSLPAPLNSKRESTRTAHANDIEPSGKSSLQSDSANERSGESTSATKSSSASDHDKNDDIEADAKSPDAKSIAEEKAENGSTDGQLATLNATPVIASDPSKKSVGAASDGGTADAISPPCRASLSLRSGAAPEGGTTDAMAANQGQAAQNPTGAGSAIKQSAAAASEAAYDADPQQAESQIVVEAATTASTDGQSVDASSTPSLAGQAAGKSEQQAASTESLTQLDTGDASSQSESNSAQAGKQVQANPDASADAGPRDTQADKQSSAAASQGDRKQRGERREKWFERGADSPSSTFGGQHEAAVNETAKAASTPLNHSGATDSTAATANSNAAMTLPDSVDALSQSVETTSIPLGAALTPTETVAASAASGSSSAGPIDSASSLGGDSGATSTTTSTTALDGGDAKSPAASTQRADAKSGANETQRPDALTQAERVRLVQRVSRSFARLGPMGGQINIRLHPPQLGSLNVQVRMEGRTMTAKLSTETSAARDVILESLPVLRTRLAEQGFEISSFHVEVADSHADAMSGNGNPQTSYDQSGGGDGQNRAGRDVDYRRLAAQQQQPAERYAASTASTAPNELAWQLQAGVDLQA